METKRTAVSRQHRLLPAVTLLVLLALGLAIRLYDLTDLPLDFHPVRQLRSAMIARGMYYAGLESAPEWKREMAVRQWHGQEKLEPNIVEILVAEAYRLVGEEHLWFGRLFSSIFWLLGAVVIYSLARKISSRDGAFVAVAYYLFLPFAVTASRSFQPDPLSVAFMVGALWFFYSWFTQKTPNWGFTIGTGLLAGLSILVKVGTVFPIFGGLIGLVLSSGRVKKIVRNPRFWVLVMLSLGLAAPYYVYGIYVRGDIQVGAWPLFTSEFITELRFYLDWQALEVNLMGFGALMFALIGTFGFIGSTRGMMIGLWLGYLLYGMAFPYHITTHSYYHLPLVPIIALGLAWPASVVLQALAQVNKKRLWCVLAIGALFLALAVQLRTARGILAGQDYRSQAGYWEHLGNLLEHRSDILELSHDYGFRLEYFGWLNGGLWVTYNDPGLAKSLSSDSAPEAQALLRSQLEEHSFLVVTILGELEANPIIKQFLYETYPVFAEGDDFVIFDLHSARETTS